MKPFLAAFFAFVLAASARDKTLDIYWIDSEGGGSTLINGTTSLVVGLERLRSTRNDPLGIVMIATGGTAMVVGIPLTIVGIVFLATRGLPPDSSSMPFTITPTASGLALSF